MKRLLELVQQRLTTKLDYLNGVFILQDPERFPRTTSFPMIILSDAGTEPGEVAGGRKDQLFVNISIAQKIYSDPKKDKAMMGNASKKGILEIAEDVIDQLEVEELEGVYHRPKYEAASPTEHIDLDESEHLQMKVLEFRWTKFTPYNREV